MWFFLKHKTAYGLRIMDWSSDVCSSDLIQPDSGAFDALPVTWAARTEAPGGKTSPEELAAAAHSSCFAMALSLCLGERKVEAEQLTVFSTVDRKSVV